jgi:acylglycerol lipase
VQVCFHFQPNPYGLATSQKAETRTGTLKQMWTPSIARTAQFWTLSISLALAACGGTPDRAPGPEVQRPAFDDGAIMTADEYKLPLHHWPAVGEPIATLLALHGFNDYGGGFAALASALAPAGIDVYAYDQRGFGSTEARGAWHGKEALANDAQAVILLFRARYPERPLIVAGKSMGAAVVLLALTDSAPAPGAGRPAARKGGSVEAFQTAAEARAAVDGVVLIAPAIAGRDTLPLHRRLALWLGSLVAPGAELSAELADAAGARATDQPCVLDQLREDPLVQHTARIEMLDHVVELMGAALDAAATFEMPALLLHGARDDIILSEAFCELMTQLPDHRGAQTDVVMYPYGEHMLTRYSRRLDTQQDIIDWVQSRGTTLRSSRSQTPEEVLDTHCS